MHHRNVQILATELYKIVDALSPNMMKDVVPLNNNLSYNTRNRRTFHSRPVRSATYGSETRGGSRAAATSKVELFVIIVNRKKP